jgi:hypothetical protein
MVKLLDKTDEPPIAPQICKMKAASVDAADQVFRSSVFGVRSSGAAPEDLRT